MRILRPSRPHRSRFRTAPYRGDLQLIVTECLTRAWTPLRRTATNTRRLTVASLHDYISAVGCQQCHEIFSKQLPLTSIDAVQGVS
jgi:hypothetical protein